MGKRHQKWLLKYGLFRFRCKAEAAIQALAQRAEEARFRLMIEEWELPHNWGPAMLHRWLTELYNLWIPEEVRAVVTTFYKLLPGAAGAIIAHYVAVVAFSLFRCARSLLGGPKDHLTKNPEVWKTKNVKIMRHNTKCPITRPRGGCMKNFKITGCRK